MTSLLNRLFGRRKRGTGATAKDRLHFVLQHDRINLPPERMEEMKREILAVIVKYLVIDQERVEIALEQRDRMHSKLVAEIPISKEQRAPSKSEPPTAQAPVAAEKQPDGNGDDGGDDNGSDDDENAADKKQEKES